jgi:tetratricopeptide (TPR) repeat protein
MASVITRKGDVKRAIELWEESLALFKRIGDVQGKAATLHNMAVVIAEQGDVERAIGLWEESLALLERIGDKQGKAYTLHSMAGVIAEQGDVERAIRLLQESLALHEWIGDMLGKAATLSKMGWLASKNEDFDEARRLYFEAGKSMATIRAWLDLITVLSNLADIPSEGAHGFLAQATWLTIRIESPAVKTLNVIAALLEKLGTEHETAPLLGAAAFFIARTRGRHHPDQEELINYGMSMLVACAAAREIEQEAQLEQWITSNGLIDPEQFMPALSSSLEAMVREEEWLFDRRQFEE